MSDLKNILKKLESNNVFLTGGAGVGKTTITTKIIDHYEKDLKKVAKLASTGMAATLINGQTLHSFLDLGISSNIEELIENKKENPKKKIKKIISSMDLIVIDEISMVSSNLFDMIQLRLKQSNFKGTLLVVGDFLQLPPVVRGSRDVSFAFESKNWDFFKFDYVVLEKIYRTDNLVFIDLLNNVRFGIMSEEIHNHLNSYIKPFEEDLKKVTYLFGKNISAEQHNKKLLEEIDSELFVRPSEVIKHISSVKSTDIDRFMDDARIDKFLRLKVGVPILFTRNSWNYFNGERGVVTSVDDEFIYIKKSDGTIIKLKPVAEDKKRWTEKTVDGKKLFIEESLFTVYQFPVKLAFAITIHKSQGMSIKNLIIETREIFAPSQFYVALSRSSNPENLNLVSPGKQWHSLIFVNSKALSFVKSLS